MNTRYLLQMEAMSETLSKECCARSLHFSVTLSLFNRKISYVSYLMLLISEHIKSNKLFETD